MESRFVTAAPEYIQMFVHKCDVFITFFLMIVKCSSMHRLKLGFINDIIDPIGFSVFINLNRIHLRKSLHDIVDLKRF